MMSAVFIAALVCLLAYGCVQFYRYRGNSSWPTVEGAIEGQPELHAVSSGQVYYARLFYSYSVNADRYSGTWESSLLVNKQHILDTISANLSSGTRIAVRYNPRKHQMSTADIDGSIFRIDKMTTLKL